MGISASQEQWSTGEGEVVESLEPKVTEEAQPTNATTPGQIVLILSASTTDAYNIVPEIRDNCVVLNINPK